MCVWLLRFVFLTEIKNKMFQGHVQKWPTVLIRLMPIACLIVEIIQRRYIFWPLPTLLSLCSLKIHNLNHGSIMDAEGNTISVTNKTRTNTEAEDRQTIMRNSKK